MRKNIFIGVLFLFLFFSCESENKNLDEDQEKDFNELPELVWDGGFPEYLYNKALYDGYYLYFFRKPFSETKKFLTIYEYDDKLGITLREVCEFIVEIAMVHKGIIDYKNVYDTYIRFIPSRIAVNYDVVEKLKNGLTIKNEFKVLLTPVECIWPGVKIENEVWSSNFFTLGKFNELSDFYDESLASLNCKWTFYGPAFSLNELKSIVSSYVEGLDDIDGYCDAITQGFFNREYESIEYLGKNFLKEMKVSNEDEKVIFDPYWDNNEDGYKYEFGKKSVFYLDDKAGSYTISIVKERLQFSSNLQSYNYNIYLENNKLVPVSIVDLSPYLFR
jgi:hypothetical protein